MSEPTIRQLAVLVAWVEEGGSVGAARRLGMTPIRVRQVLAELHAVFSTRTSAQAFAVAVRMGLIDIATMEIAA